MTYIIVGHSKIPSHKMMEGHQLIPAIRDHVHLRDCPRLVDFEQEEDKGKQQMKLGFSITRNVTF